MRACANPVFEADHARSLANETGRGGVWSHDRAQDRPGGKTAVAVPRWQSPRALYPEIVRGRCPEFFTLETSAEFLKENSHGTPHIDDQQREPCAGQEV